ncbi:hypothetical protein MTO96_035540 [Rhipicephalus appendiculatus]
MMAFHSAAPLSRWLERVTALFNLRRHCIESAFGVGTPVSDVIRFAYVAALEAAHDVFRHDEEEGPAREDIGSEESSDHIPASKRFYFMWCRDTCHLREPSLCNVPLRESRRFAATFRCPLRSPMNPLHKCVFW